MDKGITSYMKPIVATLIILIGINPAKAQTTQFTYQGKLSDGGAPATGTFDFQFSLFDTGTVGTGTQLGTTQTLTNITVTNGLFTVQLNFGACPACFNGAARFLEIAVKKTLGSTFTTLSPRQPLSSTPYAIRSLNAAAADGLSVACVNCVTSGQIGSVSGSAVSGPIPVASLPSGSGNYIQNQNATTQSGNFNISGSGTAAGTLSANIVNSTTQYNLGGNRVLAVSGVGSYVNMNTFAGVGAGASTTPGDTGYGSFNAFFGFQAGLLNTAGSDNSFFGFQAGRNNTTGVVNSFFGQEAGKNNTTGSENSFFGRYAGFYNTTGSDNAFFGRAAGFYNTTGSENSFFGRYAGFSNTAGTGNTFIGMFADFTTSNSTGGFNTSLGYNSKVTAGVSNATAIGHRAQVTQSNTLVLGSINGVNGATADTNVGIGTTAPSFRFHVRAAGQDGIKIQHNGTGDYPQIRWTDVGDAFKASIGVGPVGSEGMHFFVNGADRLVIENTGTLWLSNLGSAGSTQLCLNASNQIATCSSSLRYKTDIQPFTSGLEIINRLRPIAFVWKQGGLRDLGLAAEEVAEVEPLLVTHNDKGEVEGIKYDRINVLLINAVKQQQEQISRQQAQIKQQETAINQQQQQIKQQQNQLEALKKLVCLDHPDAPICK